MKRILSIGLLLLMFYNIGAYVFVFLYEQSHIKEEVGKLFHSNSPGAFIVLKYSKKEVGHKLIFKDDNEVIAEEKLYDIAKIDSNAEDIILYCYHDNEEEEIYAGLKDDLSNTSANKYTSNISTHASHTFALKLLLDYTSLHKLHQVFISQSTLSLPSNFISLHLSNGYPQLIISPPKFC